MREGNRMKAVTLAFVAAAATAALVDYVNPFIGTAGCNGLGGWGNGNVGPQAMVPFGALRLGPDTNGPIWLKWFHYNGYFWNDTIIRAFSHTHLQGAGEIDLGNFGVMPVRAVSQQLIANASIYNTPYQSSFKKDTETARPGYYGVYVDGPAASAEMTVSGTHSGIHRYNYSATGTPPGLLVDIAHTTHDGPVPNSSVTLNCSGGLVPEPDGLYRVYGSGFTNDMGDFASHSSAGVNMWISFIVESNAPLLATGGLGVWQDSVLSGSCQPFTSSTKGSVGAWLQWSSAATPLTVLVRTGISFVDAPHAAANLAAQQRIGGAWMSFEQAAASASASWESVLSRVQVTPLSEQRACTTCSDLPPGLQLPGHDAAAAQQRVQETADVSLRGFLQSEHAADWLALQGLPADADAALVAQYIANVSGGSLADRAAAPTCTCPSTENDLSAFYTALYHTFSAPTQYSEADGSYPGLDGATHAVWSSAYNASQPGRYFSDLSIWDVHRMQTALFALVAPDVASDFSRTLLAGFDALKTQLPRWPFINIETNTMDGSHSIGVLVDAWMKGVWGLNATHMAAAIATTLQGQDSKYNAGGWVPSEGSSHGASSTLEYAYDDGIAALFANLTGDAGNAATWASRAQNYRNVWSGVSPDLMTVCNRYANGTFDCPTWLDFPYPFNTAYTEADAEQNMWIVPHDLPGLVSLYSSPEAYATALQDLNYNSRFWPFSTFLPNAWLWMGNEPSIMAPWQFAAAGNAYASQTQYWVRWSVDAYYAPARFDSMPGNDDYSCMSAWTVFAYLGLYPIVGTGQYLLASPVWVNATVQLPSLTGSGASSPSLQIVAHNASAATVYAYRAAANGVVLSSPMVTHQQLFGLAPGTPAPAPGTQPPALLEYWLTDTPTDWQTS